MRINPDDITPSFEQRHRDAMLDLVLTWGKLDGALGMLLSTTMGQPLDIGAESFGKMPGSAKLNRVRNIIKNVPEGRNAALALKKIKNKYEKYSHPRNRIAHSNCIGIWRVDPNFVVFLAFEKTGSDKLAVEAISIKHMCEANEWGEKLLQLVLQLIGNLDPK